MGMPMVQKATLITPDTALPELLISIRSKIVAKNLSHFYICKVALIIVRIIHNCEIITQSKHVNWKIVTFDKKHKKVGIFFSWNRCRKLKAAFVRDSQIDPTTKENWGKNRLNRGVILWKNSSKKLHVFLRTQQDLKERLLLTQLLAVLYSRLASNQSTLVILCKLKKLSKFQASYIFHQKNWSNLQAKS